MFRAAVVLEPESLFDSSQFADKLFLHCLCNFYKRRLDVPAWQSMQAMKNGDAIFVGPIMDNTGKLVVPACEATYMSSAIGMVRAGLGVTILPSTAMELRANPRLSGALNAITAAVVGVILNLTVWFALHVLFAQVVEARAGPLRWYAFDPASIDLKVSALALVAALLAFVLHRGLIQLVLIMSALGIAVRLLL